MSAERIQNLVNPEESKGFKEQPVPHPKTLEFLKTTIENRTYFTIDEEKRKLIGMYYFLPGSRLKDLTSFVEPPITKKVKKTIFDALEIVWEDLSDEDKLRFPKKDVIRLKHQSYSPEHIVRMQLGPSNETRRKLSLQGKKFGFSEAAKANRLARVKYRERPDEVKQKISSTLKKKWQDPYFREKMLDSISERNANKKIWEAAQSEGLISKIVEQEMMTRLEIDRLNSYFQRKTRMSKSIDELLEKFSLVVANLG